MDNTALKGTCSPPSNAGEIRRAPRKTPQITKPQIRNALEAAREAGWSRAMLRLPNGSVLIADDAGEPVSRADHNPWDDDL
jgi:hypothetical protein